MNKPERVSEGDRNSGQPVFVSYATADRKEALAVCKAIESRGTKCWISCRDVKPGENYQEAIVRAIRSARTMVLVFSDAANNSDEIKKELSLASKNHVPVMALRIEDVEPSDAFAYELSTRQWLDAFEGWDQSIDTLVETVHHLSPSEPGTIQSSPSRPSKARRRRAPTGAIAAAAAVAVLVAAAVAGWLLLRPSAPSAHTMLVRLAGFQRLSGDLPQTMPEALSQEMINAFTTNGVVGVSTAPAPPPGDAPAYALGGTLQRDSDKVKFIATMTDERSGTTLWSHAYEYDAAQIDRIPHWAAVDASWVARCGLFAVSTYPKTLPDQTLGNYLEWCSQDSATKSLDIAKSIVAATPDFSWGWSAVEISSMEAMQSATDSQREQLRQNGLHAAAEAVRLDPSNAEAYAYKNYLIDQNDLVARMALLQQAVKARALACGCEHHFYGNVMMEVGRVGDAVGEYQRGVDTLPLNGSTQIALGVALIAQGHPEASADHFKSALDMVDDSSAADLITILAAPMLGKYDGVEKALQNPKLQLPPATVAAVSKAAQALQSQNPAEKAAAIQALAALSPDDGNMAAIFYLGALGANRQALANVEALANSHRARMWLWIPPLRGVLRDPAFPAAAQRLGLMRYWKASHTKPDACSDRDAPAFCSMI